VKIISHFNINIENKEVVFIRAESENLDQSLREILLNLNNLSWLSKISPEAVKKSFESRSSKTINYLVEKFANYSEDSNIKSSAGEYIVSIYSIKAIVDTLKHNEIPLMELLGRKISGNPGFDFYTENIEKSIIYCGEAKYITNYNAYNTSLKQIHKFILDKKHIDDIALLNCFIEEKSARNLSKDIMGCSAGFSSIPTMNDKTLVNNITNSESFKDLIKKVDYLLLIAVNVI
jgi:hypothetical protein